MAERSDPSRDTPADDAPDRPSGAVSTDKPVASAAAHDTAPGREPDDTRTGHDRDTDTRTGDTRATGTRTAARSQRRESRARDVRRRVVRAIATIVSVLTTFAVLVLAAHIVFVAFEANPGNDLVAQIGEWAYDLCGIFRDMFQPSDPKIEVAVNYGLAALAYLIVGRAVVGVLRRLA
ncbi:hypothetical protein [Actinomadura flavalba]|uniref:hypothetical protein n=1 Tax=Actinomadura flavalba TaxID=1120938 RepID=UPI00035CFFB3|nr:hypothetical protein [Actinomadura flavalba]